MAETVIDTLRLDIIVNNKGTTNRINNTTKALKNLHNVIEQINGSGGVNGAVNGGGSGGGTSSRSGGASRASNTARNLNKALNIGSIVGKLYFARNVTKQLGQTLAQVVQYGIDYEETLNLWQVAMRGNISQARTFVSEMNKAYGISEAMLMNYQAVFRNMLSALGNISEASSYAISESLTQMALDFASLYNVSVESAMTKFQAVLSGQVRPIRTAGYDITEQTLFQLYQQLGGTKTVRQLNQTEKQLLRILAVFNQMENVGATGDLKKTIESSANQLRIMKEQAKDFATWVGISLNLLLQESGILVTINSYLIVLKELAKSVAYDLGYVEKDFGIEWGDNIAEAGEEVDKLKGKLLGFDKFQVLSSAGTEDVGIEQTLLDALGAYDSILDGFENPAFEKAEEILRAMGFEMQEVKDESGEVVGYIWQASEEVSTIIDDLKLIGSTISDIVEVLSPIFKDIITKSFSNFVNNVLPIIQDVVDFISENSVTIGEIIETIFATIEAIVPVARVVVSTLLEIAQVLLPIIQKIVEYTEEDTLEVVSIVEHIGSIIKKILPILEPIFHLIAEITDLLSPILSILDFILLCVDKLIDLLFENTDILGYITILIAPLEFVLKLLRSIAAVVEALFNWDWESLGSKFSNIWSNWNISSLSDYADSKRVLGYADGGLATKGSLFYAGEAGPELVTQTSGGNSTIMNMKQLEDAVARGFIRGFASTDNGYEDSDTTEVYVDGQRLFNIMRGTAKRNGYDFVRI